MVKTLKGNFSYRRIEQPEIFLRQLGIYINRQAGANEEIQAKLIDHTEDSLTVEVKAPIEDKFISLGFTELAQKMSMIDNAKIVVA